MKILVGYDGSKSSLEALNLTKQHAKAFNAAVCVVSSMVGGDEAPPEKIEAAEKQLKFAEDHLKNEGVACETHLLIRGLSPGEDICQFAQEQKVDEIVIGVKRRSKVGKMLFGSNAQYIILNAPCPVLTVK